MILAVALMSTSCCKDDPVPEPTGPITLSELEATWVSTQYEYDIIYSACEDLENSITAHEDVLGGDLMLITVNFLTNDTDLSDNCSNAESNNMSLEYDMVAKTITLKSGGFVAYSFDIISYEREIPETLVLKLTYEGTSSDIPLNGIYTLQK